MKNIFTYRGYLKEQYSESEYDRILDIYNEYGEENMSQEEIDYLKSGGQSKVPSTMSGLLKRIPSPSEPLNQSVIDSLIHKPIPEFFAALTTRAQKKDFDAIATLVRAYIEGNPGIQWEFEFMEKLSDFIKNNNIESPPGHRW